MNVCFELLNANKISQNINNLQDDQLQGFLLYAKHIIDELC